MATPWARMQRDMQEAKHAIDGHPTFSERESTHESLTPQSGALAGADHINASVRSTDEDAFVGLRRRLRQINMAAPDESAAPSALKVPSQQPATAAGNDAPVARPHTVCNWHCASFAARALCMQGQLARWTKSLSTCSAMLGCILLVVFVPFPSLK